jgi:hypothetical protein
MTVRKFIKILLALFVFLLFGVAGANASVSHDHHEKISASPFNDKNGKSENITPHCPLNIHRHAGKVCPHSHVRDNKVETRIAVDCGGASKGAVPASMSLSKSHFLFSAHSVLPPHKSAETIFISSSTFQPFFSDRIDHPPRS